MSKNYLTEAFKELDLLENQSFDVDKKGTSELEDFLEDDSLDDFEVVIDPEAKTEEDLQKSYLGKVVLCCDVCHSMIYKDPSEVVVDEESQLANVGELCPYCFTGDGYSIVGKVAPFEEVTVEAEKPVEVKVDDKEVEAEDKIEEEIQQDQKFPVNHSKSPVMESSETQKQSGEVDASVLKGPASEYENYIQPLKIEGSDLEEYLGYWMCDWDYKTRAKDIFYNLDTNSIEVSYISQEKFDDDDLQHLADLTNKWLYLNGYSDRLVLIEGTYRGGYMLKDKFKVSSKEEADLINSSIYIYLVIDREGNYDENQTFKSFEKAEKFAKDFIKNHKEDSYSFYIYYLSQFERDFYEDNNLPLELEPETIIRTEDVISQVGNSLKESMNDISITTEDQVIKIKSSPIEGKETIQPVTETEVEKSKEAEEDISTEEEVKEESTPVEDDVEVDMDEIEESGLDEVSESYLKKVYENVQSFKTSKATLKENNMIVEGIITFTSGKKAKTHFIFESQEITKKGKLRFLGENKQLSKNKKAFTLTGSVKDKKLIVESLNYNYVGVDSKTGQAKRLYGTIRRSK